jgi:D-alanyl-D-alanine carboxypeptidase
MGMVLTRAGLGFLVGAIVAAPSVAPAAPALVFEPYGGTVPYAEDPDVPIVPASLSRDGSPPVLVAGPNETDNWAINS